MRTRRIIAVLALLTVGVKWAHAQDAVTVTLQPATRYQTILGWGKSMPHASVSPLLRGQIIDQAVNGFGLNRLRFEGLCGNTTERRSWEWLNDNADPLSINWAAFNTQTFDARATLDRADGAQVSASGMTVPGDYVFAVAVADGAHTVTRQVLVKVFAGNQPPVPMDVHNRQPVWVTVKDGGTLLRSGAWDIEGDKVSFRWSVVSQPTGAAAALETPNENACKVTGMTVPGDYVFRVEISDGEHTVAVDHTVPVYP